MMETEAAAKGGQTEIGALLVRPHGLRIVCAVTLAAVLLCALYASYYCRGLYLDGVYLLFRIAENSWFFFPAPARQTTDLIRQSPTVFLTRFTELSLLHRGQVLSLSMAILPVL